MTPPKTYAEWSVCLDAFEAGLDDAAAAAAIAGGTLEWTQGLAENFTRRIDEAFRARLRRCGDRLSRGLATSRDEATLLRAVLDCRRALGVLDAVASAEALPKAVREHLRGQVESFARSTQSSLESSARGDRSGRLALVLKHNTLLRFLATPPQPEATAPSAAPRRRTFLSESMPS